MRRDLSRPRRDGGFFHACLCLALGIFTLAVPVSAALIHPMLGIGLCIAIALCIANYAAAEAPAVLLFTTLFQNLFVSLMTPFIDDMATFNLVRGLTFLETAVLWLVLALHFLQQNDRFPPEVQRLMWLGFGLLGVIGLYAAYGFATAGTGAVIYTRNIASAILMFQIGLIAASQRRLDIAGFISAIMIIVLGLGYIELLDRALWLKLTNSLGYWSISFSDAAAAGVREMELKETGFVYIDIYDFFRITLLNSPYFAGIEIYRAHGPNMHAISYGYVLAFAFLYLGAQRHWLLAFLALPLLVFASSKGAALEIAFVLFGWLAARLFGARTALWLFLAMGTAYAGLGILTGLKNGDYHVIGLIGGIHGFLANPVGHGIGVGGNLNASIDVSQWQQAQASGAFDGAVESAIGVLLYQMGVAGMLVLGYYALIVRSAWRIYSRTGMAQHGLACWGCLAILFNGLFQEEALFAPLALGVMLCFAGIVIGSAARSAAPSPS